MTGFLTNFDSGEDHLPNEDMGSEELDHVWQEWARVEQVKRYLSSNSSPLIVDRQWHSTFKTLNCRLFTTHLPAFVIPETVTTTPATKTSSKLLIQIRGLEPLLLIRH